MANVFDLLARLRLDKDGYERDLKSASNETSSFAGKLTGILGGVGKAGLAALGAAATAISAFTVQAINSYADYEQLAGGVEKLFGDAADQMMEYAANAYKTSGMSANQYMEQATSFAAALIQSYEGDTTKAAEQADVAMRAISDNFNTFGGDISMVQSAFQGFAKQNYTMLDNLKLGYGGTKTEMERLIADANEYAESIGLASDLSIENFGDIVTAIDLIQQKQGIAGTTAKEAASTIAGSLGMVKASWQNLVTGFADPDADIGQLLSNTIDAGVTALDNLLPAINRTLVGIGEGLQKVVPIITEKLPELVGDILPPLLDAATSLVDGLITAFPSLIQALINVAPNIINTFINAIVKMLPQVVKVGLQLILAIAKGIGENLPALIPAVVDALLQVVQSIVDNVDMIIDAALTFMNGFIEGIIQAIPVIIEALPTLINALIDGILGAIPLIIEAGIQLLTSLVGAIPDIIVGIVENLPKIIDGIISGLMDNLPALINAGIELFVALVSNIPQIIIEIVKRLPEIIVGIVQGLISNIGMIIQAGVDLMIGLGEGIASWAGKIWNKAKEIGQNIIDAIKGFFSNMWEQGKNLVVGLWNGINDKIQWIKDKIAGWVDNVLGWFKKLFGIKSPSKVMAGIGDMLDQGLAKGIEDNIGDVLNAANKIHDGVNETLEGMGGDINISSGKSGTRTSMEEAMINLSDRIDNLEEIMYNAVNRALSDGFDLRFNDRELTRVVREHA